MPWLYKPAATVSQLAKTPSQTSIRSLTALHRIWHVASKRPRFDPSAGRCLLHKAMSFFMFPQQALTSSGTEPSEGIRYVVKTIWIA